MKHLHINRRINLFFGLLLLFFNSQATELPLITGETWINSAPLTTADFKDKVVLAEFWTFGCHNCKAVEPHVVQWHQKYADKGLLIIAVHSPEFSHERQPENVRAYIKQHNIAYPVVIDNDFINWRRFSNRYWPTLYLVDRHGQIRYRKIGEGDYRQTEKWIENLLNEK